MTLLEKMQSKKWKDMFSKMESTISKIKDVQKKYKLADTSAECV